MPALGDRFRAAREARGLTLSEVAEQIRIRSVYLGAIEDENWPLIGAPVYTRGFLRTYARFLSLDPEEAVADFNDLTGPPAPTPDEVAIASRAGSKGLKPWIWGASVIAVALIAFVVYQEISLQQRPDSQVALTSAAPSSSPTDAPSPTDLSPQPSGSPLLTTSPLPSGSPGASPVPGTLFTPGPSTISVQLSAPSWLRIVVDGNASIEGTFPAGTARTFRGKFAVVRVGNAGGVQILVDGKPIGPLGKAGDVVERTFTL
jgi:cytoskeletal protein RodZ